MRPSQHCDMLRRPNVMKREIGWVDDKVIVWHCDWVAGGSLMNGLFTPREALHKQVAFCPIRLGKDELRSETGLDASGLHFFQCYKTLMQLNSRSCTLGPIRPQKPPSPSPSHPTKTRKRKRNPRAPHLMRFRSLYPLRKKKPNTDKLHAMQNRKGQRIPSWPRKCHQNVKP